MDRGTEKSDTAKPRILDQGWNVLVWLVLGLVVAVAVILVLWWQNISQLGVQTDNFYRRNVIARQIAADVHDLFRRLEDSKDIVSPRRLDRQINEINALLQQVIEDSRRLQTDYMGLDIPGGMIQQAGQLQVITRRLIDVLQEDLHARRREGLEFAKIAADIQILRQTFGQYGTFDQNRYRRLSRIVNTASASSVDGESIRLIARLLQDVLETAQHQNRTLVPVDDQPAIQSRIEILHGHITGLDLDVVARRRIDATRELALLYRQADNDFLRFNEGFLGQLDVFDRNEVRDARQMMVLVLNLHMVIAVLSLLVAGYVLVSMLRNRLMGPLTRELVLLEQVLPDPGPGENEAGGRIPAESVEEEVLARARHLIGQEQVLLNDAEGKMKDARRAADHAATLAGSAAEAQNAFLASLSHQIRTPMNGVTGMLEVLTRGRLSQDQRDLVSVIGDSCDSLMRTLDDVHDYSRLESGQLALQTSSFVLEDIIVGVAEVARTRCLERGLDLSVCVDAALPRSFVGDSLRLRQVLGHLLSCIIETTDRGSVSINVSSLTPRVSPVMLRFQVIGSGVPTEDVHRWRRGGGGANWVPSSAMTEENVPRLGMMISENIVSLMGGQVEPLSGSAHTSGFVFDIPLESLGLLQDGHRDDLGGLRIGIADPAVMSRHTLENYLSADSARLFVFDTYQALEENLRQFADGDDPVQLLIVSPAFEAGERMHDIMNILEGMGEAAPRILVLTRSEDQRLPIAFTRLKQKPMTLSQPVRRLSLFRTVSVAGGMMDEDVLRQTASRKTRHWLAPDREEAEADSAVILVAEDDSTARLVIGKQLDELGYVHDIVENGEEALESLVRHNIYGMVLMDCFMPVLDGFDTTMAIRDGESSGSRHLPVAAMTASTDSREIARCRNSGMDAYLGKPVALDMLDETIATWLPKAVKLRRQQVLDQEDTDSMELTE